MISSPFLIIYLAWKRSGGGSVYSNTLGTQFNKGIVIAETAYPFILTWNDYTNNIIGLNSQILPEYPATE